jgi:hypothetical protein
MNTDHLLLVLDNSDRLEKQLAGNSKLTPAPRRRGRPRKLVTRDKSPPTRLLSPADKSLCRQLRATGLSYAAIRLKMDHVGRLPSLTYIQRVCTGVIR